MKTFARLVLLFVLVLLIVLAWVWVAQNADQTVSLRLDLGRSVGAWQLARPVSAPVLMLASFGVGLVAGAAPALRWGASRGRSAADRAYLEHGASGL